MMDNRIYSAQQAIQPIKPSVIKPSSAGMANTLGSFDQVLNQTLGGVKFSHRAKFWLKQLVLQHLLLANNRWW